MQTAKILPWVALAAVLAGLISTIYSLQTTPALLRQVARRQTDWAQLVALQQQQAGQRTAVELYQQLPSGRAVPLKDLAARVELPFAPDIRWLEDAPAADGWVSRSAEVRFDSIQLIDLARFLKAALDSRPPWRLRDVTLAAAGNSPGQARATLTMETLEKKTP